MLSERNPISMCAVPYCKRTCLDSVVAFTGIVSTRIWIFAKFCIPERIRFLRIIPVPQVTYLEIAAIMRIIPDGGAIFRSETNNNCFAYLRVYKQYI